MVHFRRKLHSGLTVLRKPQVVRALPLHFQLEPARGCNLKCRMCQVPGYPPSHWKNMSLAQFRHIFDQIKPTNVALSGSGEPFLNPELLDIVRYAKSGGASVLSTTNFTLCSNKIDDIVRSGLDLIKVSLDATTPQTFEKIRGLDRFDLIVRDLERLQEAKKRLNSATPFLRLQFVLQSDNLGEVEGMPELAHRLRADSVYFQPLETLLVSDRKEELTRGVEFDALKRRLESVRDRAKALGLSTNAGVLVRSLPSYFRKYEPGVPAEPPKRVCLLPWFSMYITVDGDVRPCCSFGDGETLVLGNLFKQSFAEIWNGPEYRALRRQSVERKLGYAVCRNCIPNRLRDFMSLSAVLPGFARSGTNQATE